MVMALVMALALTVVTTVAVTIPIHRILIIKENLPIPAVIPPMDPIPIQRTHLDLKHPVNQDRATTHLLEVVVNLFSNSPGNRALPIMNGAGEGI